MYGFVCLRMCVYSSLMVGRKHHLEKLGIQISFRSFHTCLLKLDITGTYQAKNQFYLFWNFYKGAQQFTGWSYEFQELFCSALKVLKVKVDSEYFSY